VRIGQNGRSGRFCIGRSVNVLLDIVMRVNS
jgi:hypothetical protein